MGRHLNHWIKTGCSNFVKSVIADGYKPVLSGVPENYREKNNASFKLHNKFAIEAIEKLLKDKKVVEMKEDELVAINPLSVAEHSRTKKLRLCLDQSRHVNKLYAVKRKFRIESTEVFKEVVQKGSKMICFDLKSAYHHIDLNREYWKYFGFAAVIDGKERFFAFVVLPFGFYDSARVLTKVLRHVLKTWREVGITCFIYIDDGMLAVKDQEDAVKVADKIRTDLEEFGLVISPEKCVWKPSTKLIWTGIEWDTVDFTCSVPEEKLDRAERRIQALLSKREKKITIKELASLVGLLMSFRHCVGEGMSRFYTRRMNIQIAEFAQDYGWEGWMIMREDIVEELRFWQKNMRSSNGYIIRQDEEVIRFDLEGASDAGEHQVGGSLMENNEPLMNTVFKFQFKEEDKKKSSTFRELKGIKEGLLLEAERLKGKRVCWRNDNWATSLIIQFGSMKEELHSLACDIVKLCSENQIELKVEWLSRETEQIKFCDEKSKEFDSSEYKISSKDFERLDRKYGPFSVDMFASDWSYRMKPF